MTHPPLLHPPRSAPFSLPSATPPTSTPSPLLTHTSSNTCNSLSRSSSSSSGILIRTSSTSTSGSSGGGASRAGPAYAASPPSSSSFSSDQGQGPAQGLPPPVIISPVALRVVVIGWMGCNKRYLNK